MSQEGKSLEYSALTSSAVMFRKGVDPDCVLLKLNDEQILTQPEWEKAKQKTLPDDKVDVVLTVLRRRIFVDPGVFHKLVKILRQEPALKVLGDHMQGVYDELKSTSGQPEKSTCTSSSLKGSHWPEPDSGYIADLEPSSTLLQSSSSQDLVTPQSSSSQDLVTPQNSIDHICDSHDSNAEAQLVVGSRQGKEITEYSKSENCNTDIYQALRAMKKELEEAKTENQVLTKITEDWSKYVDDLIFEFHKLERELSLKNKDCENLREDLKGVRKDRDVRSFECDELKKKVHELKEKFKKEKEKFKKEKELRLKLEENADKS